MKTSRYAIFLLVIASCLLSFGCVQAVKFAPPPPAQLDGSGWVKKDESFNKTVYFGTTRIDKCIQNAPNVNKDEYGNYYYAGCNQLERYSTGDKKTSDHINYGYAVINIPYVKKIGETTGMNIKLISSDIGWNQFKQNISSDDILVYVHGYNTTFNDAAIRSAQLSFDLNYRGVPVFFSWPSGGGLLGVFDYNTDKQRATENIKYLALFLTKIAETTDKKIHIVAHSMGAYMLTHALSEIHDETKKNPKHLAARKNKYNGIISNTKVALNQRHGYCFRESTESGH